MKVIALVPYPSTAPSTRFRVSQFIKPLSSEGVHLRVLPFFSQKEFSALYHPGRALPKAGSLVRGLRRRARQIDLAERADLVMVHRELAPLMSGPLLARLRSVDLPLVFDFDDAVFLHPRGGNAVLRKIRSPRDSTEALCQAAQLILAGNEYLAGFAREARKGKGTVQVLPTVIDTKRYRPHDRPVVGKRLVVGWLGTHSTVPYLESLVPSLKKLAARIPFQLLVVSNGAPFSASGLDVRFHAWSEKTEREALKRMDVGVYPLPEDEWTLGKCGFKAIQYMAAGVPVVASPVGVLNEILRDGETGFHAREEDQWVENLEKILSDPVTRGEFGAAGRDWVVSRYSVQAVLPELVEGLERCRRRWVAGHGDGN